MSYDTFAELEHHYNLKYNFWVDRLDNPNLSLYGYRNVEKNILFYDKKLENLHKNVEHLTYPEQ